MRIQQVRVRRYRCIRDLTISLEDYTALVGANGAGKSSVLYALDWFFNGGGLSREDVHATSTCPYDGENSDIDVEVTFTDLTSRDREVLGRYGRGESCHLRRTWNAETGAEKMFGNAMGGPGFRAVESATPIGNMRSSYRELRNQRPELPDVTNKADILQAMHDWEDDPANKDLLEAVPADNASHMFGINGPNALAKCIRFVLVPAATDIASEVGGTGRGSALHQLLGGLLAPTASSEAQAWVDDHADALASLGTRVASKVDEVTQHHAQRVNEVLQGLVPGAAIALSPTLPDWIPRTDVSIRTEVSISGETTEVARQGHGVQRAVLIAMLQAIAPHQADQEPDEQTESRFPALVVAIEEPEIFQHPVRARHFARVLSEFCNADGTQVLLATHSPYFLLPEQFESLRRCALSQQGTQVSSASIAETAEACQTTEANIRKAIEKEIPRTFAEAFFADTVLLVEGDTDRVVIETLAERLDLSLDANGMSVITVDGKGRFRIASEILRRVGIRVFILADGDALGAERKHGENAVNKEQAKASHAAATNGLISWLPESEPTSGSLPFSFGDPTVITAEWAVLHDDLETELEQWPEFIAEIESKSSVLRSKDVASYRTSAASAALAGLPEVLRKLLETLASFAVSKAAGGPETSSGPLEGS